MKTTTTLTISAALIALTACGPAEPPTRGTAAQFATVCDKANEGKRLSLDGYVGFPEQFKANDSGVVFRLRSSPTATDNVVGVSLRFGNEALHVEKPGLSYSDADLKLHTSDGKVAGYREKVRVSGTIGFPSAIATVEFKCRLDNPLIETIN